MFVFALGSMAEETIPELREHCALETKKITFFAGVKLHF